MQLFAQTNQKPPNHSTRNSIAWFPATVAAKSCAESRVVCRGFEIFGPVPSKDMQTSSPPSLRSGHLYMKNAQCAETNEKSCIRILIFLVFELLLVKDVTIRVQNKNSSKAAKFTGKMRIDLIIIFLVVEFFFFNKSFSC